MEQNALELLAFKRKQIGLDGFGVLMYVIGTLEFQNSVSVSQAEVARRLGMQRQNVHRAIKRLVGLGALIEHDRVGMYHSYQLNPDFGWKGRSADLYTELHVRMKKAKMKVVK